MKITKEQLQELNACSNIIELFSNEWPDGVMVTKENALRAAEIGLNINWLARRVLTGDALKEYIKVDDTETAIYLKETNQAWSEFHEDSDQDLPGYIFPGYVEACNKAKSKYHKEVIPALMAAIKIQENQ